MSVPPTAVCGCGQDGKMVAPGPRRGYWRGQVSVECVLDKCESSYVFARGHQTGPDSVWESSGVGKSAQDAGRGSGQTEDADA